MKTSHAPLIAFSPLVFAFLILSCSEYSAPISVRFIARMDGLGESSKALASPAGDPYVVEILELELAPRFGGELSKTSAEIIDGGAEVSLALAEGSYGLEARAVDADGNVLYACSRDLIIYHGMPAVTLEFMATKLPGKLEVVGPFDTGQLALSLTAVPEGEKLVTAWEFDSTTESVVLEVKPGAWKIEVVLLRDGKEIRQFHSATIASARVTTLVLDDPRVAEANALPFLLDFPTGLPRVSYASIETQKLGPFEPIVLTLPECPSVTSVEIYVDGKKTSSIDASDQPTLSWRDLPLATESLHRLQAFGLDEEKRLLTALEGDIAFIPGWTYTENYFGIPVIGLDTKATSWTNNNVWGASTETLVENVMSFKRDPFGRLSWGWETLVNNKDPTKVVSFNYLLFLGKHPFLNRQQPGTHAAARLDGLSGFEIRLPYSIVASQGLKANLAADFWITDQEPDPVRRIFKPSVEVLVFHKTFGGMVPFGRRVGEVIVDGEGYELWEGINSSWKVLTIVDKMAPSSTGSIEGIVEMDINAIFQSIIALGQLRGDQYLAACEIGPEIISGDLSFYLHPEESTICYPHAR